MKYSEYEKSCSLRIDADGDLAVDDGVEINLDTEHHRYGGKADGRLLAAPFLQPQVKPNLKFAIRDRIENLLKLPGGDHEYVDGLRRDYERLYGNVSDGRESPGKDEAKKKKYFLTKVRANDETTFASLPRPDSLLLVENLRGRLGRYFPNNFPKPLFR